MSLILPTFDKRIKPPLGTPLNPHLPINQGLVGCWPMNERAGTQVFDASGNGRHLTVPSGWTWVVDPQCGVCLLADGTNRMYIPFTAITAYPFTLVAAARIVAVVKNVSRRLIGLGSGDYRTRYELALANYTTSSYDLPEIYARFAGGSQNSNSGPQLTPELQRRVVVGVFASATSRLLYTNGSFMVEGTASTGIDSSVGVLAVGGSAYSGAQKLTEYDVIEFAAVYNRALTPNEIASLYVDPWQGFRRPVIEWWGAVLDAPSGTDYSFTINDGMGIGDDMGGAAAMLRGLSEAMGLGDDVSRAAAIQRAMSEAMGLTDTAARVATVLRALADSVGLTDETIEGAARQLVETINDAVGLTDAQSRLSVLVRAVADSLGMADAATTLAVLLRTISDAQGMTDGQTLARMIAVADDLGVSDEMGRIVAYLRGQSDSVGLSDTTTRLHAAVRQITDTEGLTDSYSTAWTVLRTIADTLGLTDAMIQEGTGALVRVINDVLGMVDAKTKLHAALRVLASTINTADSVSRLFAVSRVISDAEGITDGAYLGKVFTFAETIGISDEVTRLVAFLRTQDDTVGVLEAILKVSNVIRSLDDAIEMTDAEQHSLSGLVQAALAFLFLKKGR